MLDRSPTAQPLVQLALLSLLPAVAVAQDPCAPEPETACMESPVPVTLCYGEWVACDIGFSSDRDQFRFLGEAGDLVHFALAGTSVCLDPRLEVRDPSNQPLIDNTSCNVGCNTTCSLVDSLVLPVSGSYTIHVSDFGNTETGGYTLAVEKLLPDYPIASMAYAAPLQCVEIDHNGDVDFLSFEGLAGSEVLMQVTGQDLCIDPEVIVYDPTGAISMQNSCNIACNTSCSYSLHWPSLPMSGTYIVQIQDLGQTEVGTIGIGVQCLFSPSPSGLCPDAYSNDPVGVAFCTSNPNSAGSAVTLSGSGSSSVTENRVYLSAAGAPPSQFGIFFAGMNQTMAPHPSLPAPSQGLLCVNIPFNRFGIVQSCWTGQVGMRVDLSDLPGQMAVIPGDTWNWQLWYRDGPVSNTSDGIEITFVP